MAVALAACGITGWSGIAALMPLYILGEVALVGAFAGLVRRQGGVARATAIDASIITLAFAAVTWLYLVGPYATAATASGLPRASAPVVGVIDVVLVATGSLLMLGGRREGRSTLLLTGAIAALVASHLMFLWSALHGGHGVAGPDTVAWGAFCVLLAGAALHPSMRLLSVPAERTGTGLTRARLAVFAVASLVAPSVTIAQAVLHRPSHVVISIASGVIFLLVLLRIADLVREHEALTESNLRDRFEARLGSLVRNSSDVVSIVDADGVVLYISPAALRLVGLDEAAAHGMDWWEFVHPDDQPGLQWFLADLGPGASGDVEYRVRDARGSWIDVETLATNLIGDGAVEGIVLNTRDVSDRKALERRLLHQASHDTLTGLPNRMLLRDRSSRRWRADGAAAHRSRSSSSTSTTSRTSTTRWAMPRATPCSQEVARRLDSCIRSCDTATRLGGDEFAVLIDDLSDESQAMTVAERILDALAEPLDVAGQDGRADRQPRHRVRGRRARHGRRAPARRRRRDVPGQGPRQGRLRDLRAGDARRGGRAPRAQGRSRARHRARARSRSSTSRCRPPQRRDPRVRVARPLDAPRARACPTGRVHPARGGDRPHRAARPRPALRGLPSGRRLPRGLRRREPAARVCERVRAPARRPTGW